MPPAEQWATAADIAALQSQLRSKDREVRGLQGLIDKGLNSIRSDFDQKLQQELGQQRDATATQRILDQVPEENREWVGQLLQHQQQRVTPTNGAAANVAPPTALPAREDEAEMVRDVVRAYGVDPDSPGVNYAVLARTDMTEFERNQTFFNSLKATEALASASAPPRPAQQAPQQRQNRPVTPPVEEGSSNPTAYRDLNDLYEAIIQGRLTSEQAREKGREMGINLP